VRIEALTYTLIKMKQIFLLCVFAVLLVADAAIITLSGGQAVVLSRNSTTQLENYFLQFTDTAGILENEIVWNYFTNLEWIEYKFR
jgi:hypothetical protein